MGVLRRITIGVVLVICAGAAVAEPSDDKTARNFGTLFALIERCPDWRINVPHLSLMIDAGVYRADDEKFIADVLAWRDYSLDQLDGQSEEDACYYVGITFGPKGQFMPNLMVEK